MLKLKEVLKEHADAKRIAEDAPEEGEVDLNPASARATPASGASGGSLAAHIASADTPATDPPRARTTVPTVPLRACTTARTPTRGLTVGVPERAPVRRRGTPGVDAGGPYGHRPAWGWAWGWG